MKLNKIVIFGVILCSGIVVAEELSLPDLLSAPIFPVTVGNTEATSKAQEALLIQIGVTEKINIVKHYINKETHSSAKYVINTYTPFTSKQVFFVAGVGYAIFVKKSIAKSFRNPFCKDVTNTISWFPNRYQLTLQVPF